MNNKELRDKISNDLQEQQDGDIETLLLSMEKVYGIIIELMKAGATPTNSHPIVILEKTIMEKLKEKIENIYPSKTNDTKNFDMYYDDGKSYREFKTKLIDAINRKYAEHFQSGWYCQSILNGAGTYHPITEDFEEFYMKNDILNNIDNLLENIPISERKDKTLNFNVICNDKGINVIV